MGRGGEGVCVWGCLLKNHRDHPKALDPQACLLCPHICGGAGHSWGAGRLHWGFSCEVCLLAVLGLCRCRRLSPVGVHGRLIAGASLAAERGPGLQAQPLRPA